MPRKTAEEMFATQGYFKNPDNISFDSVRFTKKSENATYDIFINSEGGVDTHYIILRNKTRFWGTFQIKDVALKRCIKRYKEELKCR